MAGTRRARRGRDARRETVSLRRPAGKARGRAAVALRTTGGALVLCDSLDRGHELADDLDTPFVHGETTEHMDVFQDPENRVVIGSRVADEGLSLEDLGVVLKCDFHGDFRRQEAQRYGRAMHSKTTSEHVILMTDAEYEKHSKRLLSLEEQGVRIVPERRE